MLSSAIVLLIMTMSKTHFKVQKKIAMHFIVTSKGSIRGTRWEINHPRVSQCGPSRLLPTNMKHSRHCMDIDTGLRHLLIKLKGSFFDTAIGSRPNFARMCG